MAQGCERARRLHEERLLGFRGVDFGKAQSLKLLGRALKKALQTKATNAEFAFISRAELGLYSLLHQLDARVNVRETWRWRGDTAG